VQDGWVERANKVNTGVLTVWCLLSILWVSNKNGLVKSSLIEYFLGPSYLELLAPNSRVSFPTGWRSKREETAVTANQTHDFNWRISISYNKRLMGEAWSVMKPIAQNLRQLIDSLVPEIMELFALTRRVSWITVSAQKLRLQRLASPYLTWKHFGTFFFWLLIIYFIKILWTRQGPRI